MEKYKSDSIVIRLHFYFIFYIKAKLIYQLLCILLFYLIRRHVEMKYSDKDGGAFILLSYHSKIYYI